MQILHLLKAGRRRGDPGANSVPILIEARFWGLFFHFELIYRLIRYGGLFINLRYKDCFPRLRTVFSDRCVVVGVAGNGAWRPSHVEEKLGNAACMDSYEGVKTGGKDSVKA